jgi:glycosyltransferase involved in cell wall biosynthesis
MNRNMPTEISILIPVHGEAPFFFDTLKSLLDQSFKGYEVIIVLDRVTDNIKSLIKKEIRNHKFIKVFESVKPGISAALNLGLEFCKANYIARIDSDDTMNVDRLLIQKKYLDENPEIVCVGSQIYKVNGNSEIVGQSKYPAAPFAINYILPYRNCIAHPSVMFRKNFITAVGGYNSSYDGCEDYDLWLRCLSVGKIANINLPLTNYRIWSGQFTSKKRNSLNKCSFDASANYVSYKIKFEYKKYKYKKNSKNFNQKLKLIFKIEKEIISFSRSRYITSIKSLNKIFKNENQNNHINFKIGNFFNLFFSFISSPLRFNLLLFSLIFSNFNIKQKNKNVY